MLPAGFEPAIPERVQPQNQVVDRAATGIGQCFMLLTLTVYHLVAAFLTLGIRNFLED